MISSSPGMRPPFMRHAPRLLRHYSTSIEKISHLRGSSAEPLKGRYCVVTGGSSGIGFAIAKRYIDDGAASVTIVGRDGQRLQEAKEELEQGKHESQGVRTYVADISEPGTWFSGSGRAVMDSVDTLVNAAGVSQNHLLTYTMDEEIRHITNTNLVGTMVTTKAFIKSFMKTMARNRDNADKADFKTGSIINLSSLLGIKRGAGSTAYAASKAGILGFTRALAHEMSMREGRTLAIRVNAIVPGYIDTPMLADLANRDRLAEGIPLGRLGTPEEVADAAVFLACNSYAHNCVLNLDGGLSAT